MPDVPQVPGGPQVHIPLKQLPGHAVTPVPMRKDGSIAAMSNPMFRGDPPYTGAWADCAYDPETPGPLYHPDQICVSTKLDEVLRLYAKAALRDNPEDIIGWSQQWFVDQLAQQQKQQQQQQ
eukprot:CAMPEP_0174715366 /NCGR_PEP_ID=MMETSP1094-20130205/21179_1 /TAXON_ID=156173 /ORGANISM="Chrysochromulina brevifilum, Strain UTEX LB 985" /LENGTH=121 /DNA_ID=CAMNT_0015914927 /DNA_START=30 /DNA_END=395 /DNA_ORIENTATION=-